jgi:hypothetical protein
MLDIELLRAVCKELLLEQTSEHLQELLSFLCAVADQDDEEVRQRLPEICSRYPSLKKFRGTKATPKTSMQRQGGSRRAERKPARPS